MNGSIHRRLLFDTFMFIVIITLMDTTRLGLSYHERAGIATGLILLTHTVGRRLWLRGAFKGWANKRLTSKTILLVCLNGMLATTFMLTFFTGLIIARTFPYNLPFGTSRLLISLHHSTAYGSLILLAVHMGFHWGIILRRMSPVTSTVSSSSIRWLGKVAAILIIMLGIRSWSVLGFAQVLTSPITRSGPLLIPADTEDPAVQLPDELNNSSLQEYLGRIICNGCSRHCLLTEPQCGVGVKRARDATVLFVQESNAASQPSVITGMMAQPWFTFPAVTGLFICGTYYLVQWVPGRKRRQ